MKKWAISFVTGLLAGAMLLPAALASETKVPPPPAQLIPAGSLLHVRLTCTLTSKTSKPGDPFTGIVTTPITVDGKEVIAAGSYGGRTRGFCEAIGPRLGRGANARGSGRHHHHRMTSSWPCPRGLTT